MKHGATEENTMRNSCEDSVVYDETEYLLSSHANEAHLMESIAQAQQGNFIPLDELLETVNETLKARG